MAKFDYDETTDSLFISNKKKGEKIQGSAEIGNIIIDFTTQGKVANIEFFGISDYLKMAGFNPSAILNNLREVKLNIYQQKGAILIFAQLTTPNVKKIIPLANIPIIQ